MFAGVSGVGTPLGIGFSLRTADHLACILFDYLPGPCSCPFLYFYWTHLPSPSFFFGPLSGMGLATLRFFCLFFPITKAL